MDPDRPDIQISDVVVSTAGRDKEELFYVVGTDGVYVLLANGRERKLEKPKSKKCKHVRKVLRSETRVAGSLLSGAKCSTANYAKTWPI